MAIPNQKLLPYRGVIVDIEYWLHFLVLYYVSFAAYSDYLKRRITKRKSWWRILEM